MADSKITQLPLSPYALDKDYIIAVTGHLEDGGLPYNVRMPLSYIRRYIVRLNLLSNQVSGIDSYYNSGLNILTTWTTGIHAVPGNNIEVQFDNDTPASNLYGGTGPICYSGIISTTGLNSYGGNKIGIEYDTSWPYSGIISSTGVNFTTQNNIKLDLDTNWPHSGQVYNTKINAIKGNLIDIAYNADSLASSGMHNRNGPWYNGFNSGIHVAGKYHSGILSITGVNAVTENNIVKEYQDIWPYSGIYYNTGINAIAGNGIDITYDETNKYKIATLATTGLNMIAGDGILYSIEDQYPYRYIISSIGTAKTPTDDVRVSTDMGNTTIAEIQYDNFPEIGQIDLMVTAGFKVLDIVAMKPGRPARTGDLDWLKSYELSDFLAGVAGQQAVYELLGQNRFEYMRDGFDPIQINSVHILHRNDLGNFFDPSLAQPLSGNWLQIGIAGTGTNYFSQYISTPITFTDIDFSNSYHDNYQEIYRSGKYPYGVNELDPMYITDKITLNLTGVGSEYAQRNWPRLHARWSRETDYERLYFVYLPTELSYTNERDLNISYPDSGYTGIYPLQTGENYTYFYEFYHTSGNVKLLTSSGPDIELIDTSGWLHPVPIYYANYPDIIAEYYGNYNYINFTTSAYVTGIQEIILSSGITSASLNHGWWQTSLRTQALSAPINILTSGTYDSYADIVCTSIKAEAIAP